MQTDTHTVTTTAVRAEALFASALQRSDEPSGEQVRHAVMAAMGDLGSEGCAERMAQEFGDHPDAAALRMRWVLTVAGERSPDDPRELVARPGPVRRSS